MKDQLLKLVQAVKNVKAELPAFSDEILVQILLDEITAIACGEVQWSDAVMYKENK